MRSRHICKLILTVVIASFWGISAPGSAHANASCSSLLSGKFSYLQQNAGSYSYTVTMAKDSLNYVTFTNGNYLSLNGEYLTNSDLGWTDIMQFSDRYNGNQNFNINTTEPTQIWIDQNGHLWIWNNLYHYWIVNSYDMSCVGNLISSYVSGLGVVTVRIGSWSIIG